jgi:predicted phosphatase
MNSKTCRDNFGNIFQIETNENTSLIMFSKQLSKLYQERNLSYHPENFKYFDKNNTKVIKTDQELLEATCIGIMIIPIKCESLISNYLIHNPPLNNH